MRSENPDITAKLVLIGGDNPLFADVKLQVKEFSDDIIFKGYVSDSLLKSYYKHALVVAYPSLYEGFGLPPLEAMASGAPVMTSNTSSLPEVVGDAALLVNPNDKDQIAKSLETIIRDPQLRRDMRAKGAAQVKKFNWARVARNIVGIYYETYNKKNGKTGDSFLSFDKWRAILDHEKKWL
jgi:glycosyltransferase involved in cell wall biosynthesis